MRKQTCVICKKCAEKSKFQAYEFKRKIGSAVCSECIAVAFGPCCLRMGVCLPCGHFRPATAGTEQAVWCVKVLDNAQEALRVRMLTAETAAVEEGAAMRSGITFAETMMTQVYASPLTPEVDAGTWVSPVTPEE